MSEIEILHRQFCEYSLTFKGNTPQTINWLRSTWRYFQRGTGIEHPSQLERSLIERWIVQEKLEKGWSPKTVRNYLQVVGLFSDWLVREGYLEENPVAKIPKPRLPHTIRPHLTVEKAQELLDWTRQLPVRLRL